ncbi:MAG: DUF2167 domain-containing protein [Pseudomonadota bacterium]
MPHPSRHGPASLALCALLAAAPVTVLAQSAQELAEREALAAEGLSAEQIDAYLATKAQILESLDRRTGTINLRKANATLVVPDNFYYLDADDAQTVLVDIWGNPPGEKGLGMLFPAEYSPFDGDSWGVTIDWQEDGYVSDEDANEIDYDELLGDLQQQTREANRYRQEEGYPTVNLLGWAERPYYDGGAHKLYWAKELSFEGMDQNTLNYDIRVLGRRGVLVLSFIAGMEQKADIDASRETVLAMAEFNEGDRYTDYVEGDKLAGYGIGALVAGAAGFALAKKGILAAVLIFLKKFGALIAVGAIAAARGLFGGKKKAEQDA